MTSLLLVPSYYCIRICTHYLYSGIKAKLYLYIPQSGPAILLPSVRECYVFFQVGLQAE